MAELLNNFHFLRPLWLCALVPALLLAWLLARQSRRSTGWQDIIAPELLQHLLTGQLTRAQKLPLFGVLLAWLLASIAMAGPTWEKLPQPVHKTESALVILLDLSPSMLAEDLKPSRLVRARHKLTDLLNRREEGVTALIAYAGEAHVVTPLTDDTATIISLLPALHPGIMPLQGSNTEMAVDLALQLFQDAGANSGNLLLVTDGVDPAAHDTIKSLLSKGRFQLSILGVGTDDGAPIPTQNGGFAKDDRGGIVLAMLNSRELQQLAVSLGGLYTPLRANEGDIRLLESQSERFEEITRQLERDFDNWRETGPYLVLALLPILLCAFRRGWLLCLALALPLLQAPRAHASLWDDLWARPDQQGQASLRAGDPGKAAQAFEDPRWRGTAHYRAGDFEAAIQAFAQGESATDDYNRGNALAQAGRLDEAIEAYKQALAKDPELVDAKTNLDILEKLKQQQQNNQQQGQNGENQNRQDNSQQNNAGQQNPTGQQNPEDQQNSSRQNDGSQNRGQQDPANRERQNRPEHGGAEEQESQHANREERKPQQEADESEAGQRLREQTAENAEQEAEQKMAADQTEPGKDEEQQALEQWLRQVPDDPSGLMRNKFEYQYLQRRKEYRAGRWEPPENEANKRW